MHQLLKHSFNFLFITLVTISLTACDGFDFDSADGAGTTPERTFTRSELAFSVLYSSLVLNNSGLNNNSDGFIVLFNSSADLDQIELKANDNNNALLGNYPWTIENDKLQVTYPNGVTCTSTKTAEAASQYTASSSCDGGEPENDRIRNVLLKPSLFEAENIAGRTVIINDGDDDRKIDFYDNGNFEIRNLDSSGDEIASSLQIGTVDDSIINNVVRLDHTNTDSDKYSLLVLLDGSLSQGTMLELNYIKSTDTLTEVFIYDIEGNNQWEVESTYDDITFDN